MDSERWEKLLGGAAKGFGTGGDAAFLPEGGRFCGGKGKNGGKKERDPKGPDLLKEVGSLW